jgi:phosphonate transport system permease protein
VKRPLHEIMLADRHDLQVRHAALFHTGTGRRMLMAVAVASLAALALYGFHRLEFSFDRLGSGATQIAHIIGLMFPPSPGSQLPVFLQALAETLAIALVGTLAAAILAFPMGLLAARNSSRTFSRTLRRDASST